LAGKKEKTRNSIICFVVLYKNFMQLSLLINILPYKKEKRIGTPRQSVSAHERDSNAGSGLVYI
jgi:hypothetical protein